jgi:hypothetical protein
MNNQILEERSSFVCKPMVLAPGLMKIYQSREVLISTSTKFSPEDLERCKSQSSKAPKFQSK